MDLAILALLAAAAGLVVGVPWLVLNIMSRWETTEIAADDDDDDA